MAPLEPWEKVFVSEEYTKTLHGFLRCTYCHGGVQEAADKEAAHKDMVANPLAVSDASCSECHEDVSNTYATALHNTQAGYWTQLDARSVPENHENLEEMFGNHCATCHTSCGECHVSQPENVGGGLLDGHMFVKTPPMTRTCTACHGSRVGNEYLGKNEEIPGDVHFRTGRMNCVSCHTGGEMHATDEEAASHRYAGKSAVECTDCHQVGGPNETIPQHAIHGNDLSCQVCHSVQYTSCDNCHVAISDKTGNPFYKTDGTYLGFYIGLNTRKSADRPYDYVTVRHIPAHPDAYSYYGENLQPNFDAMPTWAYATPHNIQRVTPQNQSCDSCHGNPELFLTADKVAEEELEANQGVIVPQPPDPVLGQ